MDELKNFTAMLELFEKLKALKQKSLDETIIDVNTQNLDLSVKKNNVSSTHQQNFQDKLRKKSEFDFVSKLKNLVEEMDEYEYEYGYDDDDDDDYNEYKFGDQYKEELGLNQQEVTWLNKFYYPTNVFLSIEECCIATIMQYLKVLKEFQKQLKKKKTTLSKKIIYFKNKIKAICIKNDVNWEYYRTGYFAYIIESELYLTLFKRVENSVRASFGHKRKVSVDFPYRETNLSEEFEITLGNPFNALIEKLKGNIDAPSIETQIELNTQNVNRWKIELDELIVSFPQNKINIFIDGIVHLEKTNQKNPNIKNIFYQASKFISKYDKVQSLKYYAKYIFYDLESKKFEHKKLAKTVQKLLFKTEEQINAFNEIIADLIATKDIQTAIEKISKIDVPKRKQIQLNQSAIKLAEQKHENTVELLNEYLVDEKETPKTGVSNKNGEDIDRAITHSIENNSVFISAIRMGQIQEQLVKMIINNSFEISQDKVDKYATENGMFKNQLIDSINAACEKYLDGEALIEEDDENYIIEESYYKEITK